MAARDLEAPLVAVDASAAMMNREELSGRRAGDGMARGLCRKLPSIRTGVDQYGMRPQANWLVGERKASRQSRKN
jgi:hypothetical protein